MNSRIAELWPRPATVADRWRAAQVRMALYKLYGHPSGRRRARILARAAELRARS
ncbi:hypothetical protein [Nocardia tengchongensis]|uniref:hypothetical protein n=1 Tax=Nocardia tengchongensis TaxID=2055889 RepID=UPI0036743C80